MDYAASTPVDKAVIKAMAPYFDLTFGNPHALHFFGQKASSAVFQSRRSFADSIGADYREILFTGSATEANNLAIRGIVRNYLRSGGKNPRVIVSVIEHESILETSRDLEKDGVEIVYLPVSSEGLVDPDRLARAINSRTVLVSVMHANNEVGVVQPVKRISEIVKAARGSGSYPVFHTDAAQSLQYLDCSPKNIGADLITFSAHKIYGPKGIGALYVGRNIQNLIQPVITGSGQEGGLRSGTDNVPYIVGFAKALELANKMKNNETLRIAGLRDYFWAEMSRKNPGLRINGSVAHRLPNNLNIYFPGKKAHDLQIALDLSGVAVSTGAACSVRVAESSHVLEAMGFDRKRSSGSLRFSLGRSTTKKDLQYVINVMSGLLQ